MSNEKKAAILRALEQQANEIIDNGMLVIDDHMDGAIRKVDHLVILEAGEGVFLCPIIDSLICCCLNAVIKEDDGYHLTYMNVGGNVWNKQFGKNICDRCADYNAEESNFGKIIGVIC